MKRSELLVLCLSLFATPFIARTAEARWETWVTVPATQGEDLTAALRRVNPCMAPDSDEEQEILSQYFTKNHEGVGQNGTHGHFVVAGNEMQLPEEFVKDGQRCKEHPEPLVTHPAIEPEPKAPHEAETEAEEQSEEYEFRLGAFAQSTKLDVVPATGGELVLHSKAEFGGAFEAIRSLSDFVLGVRYQWAQSRYNEPADHELIERASSTQEASLLLGYEWDEFARVTLGIGAGQVERLTFPDPANPEENAITINSRWDTHLSLETELGLFDRGGFLGSLALGASLWLPTADGESVGIGEEAGFILSRRLCSHMDLELAPRVGYERQQDADESHSVFVYAVGLGVRMAL